MSVDIHSYCVDGETYVPVSDLRDYIIQLIFLCNDATTEALKVGDFKIIEDRTLDMELRDRYFAVKGSSAGLRQLLEILDGLVEGVWRS